MSPPPLQDELFDRGPAAPVDVAPGAARWAPVAERLPPGVRFATSSWSFPGWVGRVWDREVSGAVLARAGLAAYARHPLLRAAAIDRTYYGPLPSARLAAWADATPADFRFLVKADRRLVFPDGPDAEPDLFLNPAWAAEEVVGPAVEGLGPRLGALLFQFPPMSPERVGGPRRFAESLYRFLSRLPESLAGRARVELRTPELAGPDYVEALRHAGAGHGFVVHPEMDPLASQWARLADVAHGPAAVDVDRVVSLRWMLRPGWRYAEAKEAWAPFDRLRAADDDSREAVVEVARAAVTRGGSPLIVVNNKAEGSAPASIERIAGALGGDPTPLHPDATD